jgi:gamma-glutamyltranspeptidase/glutathione hydrolase
MAEYSPPPHVTENWTLTKPAASGRRGMVVAQARAAAEAGVTVLEAGGNAVDAAVATAFALAVVEPWNSGLGGIGFGIVHPAGQARAEVVDFGPVSPRGLDPALFRLTGRMKQDLFPWPEVEGDLNVHGALSFAAPSAVAGYAAMHARWGRMPMRDLLDPAIALARRGLPQDWFTTLKIAAAASVMRLYSESARIYLPGGLPPAPPASGPPSFLRLGQLAATLERLQIAGTHDFYTGEIAAQIAADTRARGGVLSREDLASCAVAIRPAQEVKWRGAVLQLPGGLTAGPTLARVLGLMGDAQTAKVADPDWFAALARSAKAAYAERLAGLGDAEPRAAETCTTHLTVCDAEGAMVSLTTTLLSSMGSRMVLPQTGVLMNNGIMWFDPRPGAVNGIGPGKRPLTNMCPVVMAYNDRPVLAAGASGGRRIMTAVLQLLEFVAGFGMTVEEAAHHPRIDISGPDLVTADSRLPSAAIEALRRGGAVELAEHTVLPLNFACPNLIHIAADGVRHGISDARSPWSAALAQAEAEQPGAVP